MNRSAASNGEAVAVAVRHGFFWLMVANGVGVLLALLLVWPDGNLLLGEWTYGRWIPLHLNLQLYGWTSLPLVAWLLRVYRVDATGIGGWGVMAVRGWSVALVVGALTWLAGLSTGKIFLDWTGIALGVFVVAMVLLWLVAVRGWLRSGGGVARFAGLVGLLTVPVGMVFATSRSVYPPVNPDTGGPTGASLLGSTLVVVFLLLLVPGSLGRVMRKGGTFGRWCWVVLGVEAVCWGLLERPEASHRDPAQWMGLGLLLVWVVLLPVFFSRFEWSAGERRWMKAFLAWLGLLIVSGWMTFLPGVLDAGKFTNVLVAHTHLAMAGFTSSFLVFVSVAVTGWERVLSRGFRIWHGAALGYVLLMLMAGWMEAGDPRFVMEGGAGRDVVYGLRLLCGLLLFGVSAWWWRGAAGEPPRAVEAVMRERVPRRQWLVILQVALGGMDGMTGVMLVVAPAFTLGMMGVEQVPESLVMVSWVGVFVLAVGLSYFLVLPGMSRESGWAGWRMQWKVSGLVRLVVGSFVAVHLATGMLEAAWVLVAATDLGVAGLQGFGLARGWLGGKERGR